MQTQKSSLTGKKLREIFEKSGEDQPTFAASIGVKPRTLRKFFEGCPIPFYVELLLKVKKKFKLDGNAMAKIDDTVEL